MKTILAVLFALNLFACLSVVNTGIAVKITNASEMPVSNLVFTTTEKLDEIIIERIIPGETINSHLSMKKTPWMGLIHCPLTETMVNQFISPMDIIPTAIPWIIGWTSLLKVTRPSSSLNQRNVELY